MGQSSSKPPPSSMEHVFTSDTPVRFSQDLVNALQASPETDSTRSSDLELHISRRVAAELERLSNETSQQISTLSESISTTPDSTTDSIHLDAHPESSQKSSAPDAVSRKEGDRIRDLGRQSVQKEVDDLKKKLQQRKIKDEVAGDKQVVAAKESVVKCLRENDRRPLDCWKEVDDFKKEVGRLEKGFLGRVWD